MYPSDNNTNASPPLREAFGFDTRVRYPAGFTFFFFFCVAPFTMYQKPVIDHCPWPSSQFNKWHAQNKLLSSSLIGHREQPLVHSPLTPANHCRRKVCLVLFFGKICQLQMTEKLIGKIYSEWNSPFYSTYGWTFFTPSK
jgi:hypothetical protein